MELNEKKINFLGDSITQGAGTSDIRYVYWNVVAQRTGAICRGYGIGGTRIAAQRNRLEPIDELHYVTRVDGMDPDADVIVVFGGTNDYGHGDAPLGSMNDRTDESFYGALHLLIQKLYARYPEATIVLMTPTHRLSENRQVNERGVRNVTNLAGYVQAEREVAEYYGIPVLDLYRVSGISPEIPEQRERFMPDGLHPSDAGNAILADRLIGFLKTL